MKNKIGVFIGIIAISLRIFFLFSKENNNVSKIQKHNNTIINNNIEELKVSEIEDTPYNVLNTDIKENEKLEENNKIQYTETKNTIIEEKTVVTPIEYDIQNIAFFSQAPLWIRDQPYQDACEEASLLIWQYYLKDKTKTKKEYNKDLLVMVELEMQLLGYFKSTTIMETKQVINKRDPTINARIIENPSINDLEKEISQNHIIIAPLYGKWLWNPHYALWWPDYHFLVIKWYTRDQFITHDVWTLKWENRYYDKSLIMNNIHDRNRTDVRKWAPRVLVIY